MKFSPEAGKSRADDVALVDRLLKSIVPDAEFDGARVIWQDGKDRRTATPAEYSLSPDTLAACRRLAKLPGSDDLLATIVLRPLQRMLAPANGVNPAIMTKMGNLLNRISSDRKMLAAELLQKELAKIAAERKPRGKPGPPAPEGNREGSPERMEDLNFLFATYRAEWIASGGHADPSTFHGAPESLRKWGMNADRTMRMTIDQPADESIVRGTALELFLGVEIERQRWFGAEVVRVAAVDDYSNSLDLALEFPFDAELGIVPRLAIDFTTSESNDVLSKKILKLGKGTSVNFFRSKVEKNGRGEAFEGRVEDLPMVILGVNGKVLSDVGASLRRGEQVGPEHAIRTVLLRQAEIQVGLQIRTIAAEFARNALRNMPTDAATLRAVEAYATGFESGGDFLANVSAIRDIMRSVPVGGMDYYLGRQATNRFRNLLAVHANLEARISETNRQDPEASRMAGSIKLSRRLEAVQHQPAQSKISPIGEIFLRVAGLGFIGQPFRRASYQKLAHLPLGIIGLSRERVDCRERLVGRAVGWGYLVFRLLGHRV